MKLTVPVIVALGLALLTACGGSSGDAGPTTANTQPPTANSTGSPDPSAPTTAPSSELSTTQLPTISRPPTAPTGPSDQITGLWVPGVVIPSSGPCYLFSADDGRSLTVYGAGTLNRYQGQPVQLRIALAPGACAAEESWRVLEVKPAAR